MKENFVNIAEEYRITNNRPRTGVVLIFEGKAYGWKDKLRNPEEEMPNAIAVDEHNRVFKVVASSKNQLAACWVAV